MQKNLYTRSKFAELAGVNPSTVTRLCSTLLKGAMYGKQIDADHPDAVAYLAERDRTQTAPAATGLDPLYESAVAACKEADRYSATFIQKSQRVGYNRAARIYELMRLNGVAPEPDKTPKPAQPAPQPKPKPQPTPSSKPRGQAVVKQKKKESYSDDEPLEVPEDLEAFADMSLRQLIHKFGTDVRFVDWLNATQKIEAIQEKRLKNAATKGELISRDLVQTSVVGAFNAAHLRLLKDGAKSITAGVVSKHAAGLEPHSIEAYVSDIIGSFIRPVKTKITKALKE